MVLYVAAYTSRALSGCPRISLKDLIRTENEPKKQLTSKKQNPYIEKVPFAFKEKITAGGLVKSMKSVCESRLRKTSACHFSSKISYTFNIHIRQKSSVNYNQNRIPSKSHSFTANFHQTAHHQLNIHIHMLNNPLRFFPSQPTQSNLHT
jgi:hypothetical protein